MFGFPMQDMKYASVSEAVVDALYHGYAVRGWTHDFEIFLLVDTAVVGTLMVTDNRLYWWKLTDDDDDAATDAADIVMGDPRLLSDALANTAALNDGDVV